MSDQFAPSEEMVLHCDVKGCQAQVSLVGQVARTEHGWGRVTLYDSNPGLPWGDYDLCGEHNKAVLKILEG